jgi:hypothetical protein
MQTIIQEDRLGQLRTSSGSAQCNKNLQQEQESVNGLLDYAFCKFWIKGDNSSKSIKVDHYLVYRNNSSRTRRKQKPKCVHPAQNLFRCAHQCYNFAECNIWKCKQQFKKFGERNFALPADLQSEIKICSRNRSQSKVCKTIPAANFELKGTILVNQYGSLFSLQEREQTWIKIRSASVLLKILLPIRTGFNIWRNHCGNNQCSVFIICMSIVFHIDLQRDALMVQFTSQDATISMAIPFQNLSDRARLFYRGNSILPRDFKF